MTDTKAIREAVEAATGGDAWQADQDFRDAGGYGSHYTETLPSGTVTGIAPGPTIPNGEDEDAYISLARFEVASLIADAPALLIELCDDLDAARAEKADYALMIQTLENELIQLSEDGNKVSGAVVTLLDRIGSLQAENDRLRAGMRSAAAVIDAYIQDFADIQTADGIDAADTYTALRSLLEADGPAEPESQAAIDVLAERRRQITQEGWDAQHDDHNDSGELSRAAACYAWFGSLPDEYREDVGSVFPVYGAYGVLHALWPWASDWWKPKDPRRDLVRAGALIVAEIERLDRRSLLEGGE